MSAAAARPFDAVAGRGGPSAAAPAASSALSRREATLRSAATTCLAGIALMQALELPSALARGATVAVLSFAAIVACVGGGLALVAADATASGAVWRAVAAIAVLVLAGWGLPHSVALPEGVGARGDWAAMPGGACAALAAVCLVLAALAVRPTRAAVRGLATAAAVLVALGPPAATFLVAAGPGPPGGDAAIAADDHAQSHSIAPEPDIVRRPGRNGDHFVIRVAASPRSPAIGRALVAVAAAMFTAGAVASLRRRSVASPAAPAGEGDAGQPAGGHGNARSRAR